MYIFLFNRPCVIKLIIENLGSDFPSESLNYYSDLTVMAGYKAKTVILKLYHWLTSYSNVKLQVSI